MDIEFNALWVLSAAILVFTMQAGFMCLEAGLTRSKNSINVAVKNMADFGISILCFWLVGFGLMFGHSWQGWLGTHHYAFNLDAYELSIFFIFQMVFCSTATSIVSGAVAERLHFKAYLLIAALMSLLLYPLFGHWAWNGLEQGARTGWLGHLGFVDFAGSTVVHSIGGWVALAVVLVIGPRTGRFDENGQVRQFNSHSLPLTVLGMLILWVGWLGFNGGSTLAFNESVPLIIGNTMIAGAAGMLAALIFGWSWRGEANVMFLVNGTLGGLVAVTANVYAIDTAAAVVIGMIGGIIVVLGERLLEYWQIDDVVGAIPVHLGAGIWGTIAVALFADLALLDTGLTRWEQLLIQLFGISIAGLLAFGVSYSLFALIHRFISMRVPLEAEEQGLNVWEHKANTELRDLLEVLYRQATTRDFSLRAREDPFTEIGQVGTFYNLAMSQLDDAKQQIEAKKAKLEEANQVTERLNAQLEQARHLLEDKVQQRTRELREANQNLKDKIQENERLFGEVHNYSKELEQKNAALRQMNQLKDEFLANTSHELRTPLNGIIGLAESLLDGVTGQLSEQTRANLHMIVASGRRLSSLVNDILDFSQLRHRSIQLQRRPVDMKSSVDIVLALSQPLTLRKNLALVNTIDADLPAVYADENRLQQILHNLIGNAIKFTDRGYITVSARLLGTDALKIIISDTGIGIATDRLERIFEAFEQAEGDTARVYGGTGLGLAITKQLIELHQGTLSARSEAGKGSEFQFTLPISTEKAEKSTLPVDSPAQQPHSVGTEVTQIVSQIFNDRHALVTDVNEVYTEAIGEEYRIMIVDDEPINLQVLANHLSLRQYQVIEALSGEECLKLLRAGSQPDLVVLDVMMPHMTGYEVTQHIRELRQADELPIILLTAKNQVSDLVQGLELGANDYLTKPISKDELLARIKTHLHIRQLKAENMRMSAELDITRRLQQMVLPRSHELKTIPGLDIAGYMAPAAEVGGDYYDVLQYNGRVLFGIGDVTGHGLESGVLMLMVQMAVRTLLVNGVTELSSFMHAINRAVFDNVERMQAEKNLTMILLDYQPDTQQLLVTGQHEEIIVVRHTGTLEQFDTIDLGFPVGLTEDISEFVKQIDITLQTGDVVVLYTDGITEAENVEGGLYGLERLCALVKQHREQMADVIRQCIVEDVNAFIGEQEVFDDITLLVVKQQ